MKEQDQNHSLELLWDKFRLKADNKAMSVIYFEFYDQLLNYGLKHTCNRQIVEDSIQNMFSYLLKVRKNLNPVNNLAGYLIKSFRNQLMADLKAYQKHIPTDNISEDYFSYFSSHEQKIIETEQAEHMKKVIRGCLKKLSSKQQEIIFLRFNCDLSYEDISAILGITVESCHTTVYRSIKSVRIEADKILSAENKLRNLLQFN